MTWQEVLVGIIVGLAALYLVRKLVLPHVAFGTRPDVPVANLLKHRRRSGKTPARDHCSSA